jgi:hypothetical protein
VVTYRLWHDACGILQGVDKKHVLKAYRF